MATIERRPLPPFNSKVTPITEADRAQIIAGARDVIDHYLNGPGSYWNSGPRKPLEETINDLERFKNQVIASKQFADDPNSIMVSVVEFIKKTTEQVEQAARSNEGRDNISLPPPYTDDPIDDPRVTSPRALSNAALPISLPAETEQAEPPAAGVPGTPSKPLRILSRRIVSQSPASAFGASAPAAPDRENPYGDRFGSRTSSPQRIGSRNRTSLRPRSLWLRLLIQITRAVSLAGSPRWRASIRRTRTNALRRRMTTRTKPIWVRSMRGSRTRAISGTRWRCTTPASPAGARDANPPLKRFDTSGKSPAYVHHREF